MEDESSSVILAPEVAAQPRYGLRAGALSDLGLRHELNEDSHAIARTSSGGALLVVCDGMGGMGRGDQASQLALKRLEASLLRTQKHPLDAAKAVIQEVDLELTRELSADASGKRPGTTCAVVHIEQGVAYVTWVGDSSVLIVRDGAVVAQTRPHRMVQDLIDAGAMSPQEALTSPMRRFLARSLGGRDADDAPVEPSMLRPWRLVAGDAIVVCSDGLSDFLSPEEIAEILRAHGEDEQAACRAMVDAALAREADDNVTVIVARCVEASASEDEEAAFIAPAWDYIDGPLGAFDEPDYHSDIRVSDLAEPEGGSEVLRVAAWVTLGGLMAAAAGAAIWGILS